jgi:hypothetical protein
MLRQMIKIETNVIKNSLFTNIENLIVHPKFNYSMNCNTEIVNFYHTLYYDNNIVSPFAHVINPVIDFLKMKVSNAMIVVVPKTNEKKPIFKKIEKPLEIMDTITCVYFINTNNGNFNLFNFDDIDAEQNKIFMYDSNLEVTNFTCTDKKFKVYLQLEFFKGSDNMND